MKLKELEHEAVMVLMGARNGVNYDFDDYGKTLVKQGGYKDFETRFLWSYVWVVLKSVNGELFNSSIYDKYNCNDDNITSFLRSVCKKMNIPTNEEYYKALIEFNM